MSDELEELEQKVYVITERGRRVLALIDAEEQLAKEEEDGPFYSESGKIISLLPRPSRLHSMITGVLHPEWEVPVTVPVVVLHLLAVLEPQLTSEQRASLLFLLDLKPSELDTLFKPAREYMERLQNEHGSSAGGDVEEADPGPEAGADDDPPRP